MSTLRVNKISNLNDNGPVEFTKGVEVPANQTVTGDINLSGICTATAFVGNGNGITVTGGATNAKIFATVLIT
jgi:hypothetical protein